MRRFFDDVDLIALPTVQVVPFPVELDWVHEIEGVPMENYLTWMRSCTDITVTGCPAISVPGGFTPEGLPVGVQLVAAPGRELLLLQVAHALDGDGVLDSPAGETACWSCERPLPAHRPLLPGELAVGEGAPGVS
ncbi:MAG: amidase family protein [Ilumatobacteraceae bacterium]